MKHIHVLIASLALLLSLASCRVNEITDPNEELSQFTDGIEVINASVESYETEEHIDGNVSGLLSKNSSSEVDTKSTLAFSGAFSWETTDQLIFWPSQSSTYSGNVVGIPFRVSNVAVVEGKSYATFEGDGWALRRGGKYYASTPLIDGSTSTKVSVDYSGQNPIANEDETHLGKYDYLHSSFTTPSEGDASITFRHLGSIRRFILHLPVGASIEEGNSVLVLSSEDKIFCEKAYYNPSVDYGSETFTKATSDMVSEVAYVYGNAQTPMVRENLEEVTITIMMMPTEWAEKEITVTFKDLDPSSNNIYSASFTPSTNIRSATRGTVELDMERALANTGDFLTFTTTPLSGANSVTLNNVGGNQPELEYSYDGTEWIDWDEANYTALEFNSQKPLYIRGNNLDGFSKSNDQYSSFVFSTDASVRCDGDVMSLLSYENTLTEIPNDYCFRSLFINCGALVSAPSLTATILKNYCYTRMFSDCTNLLATPELPATTLSVYCYFNMFDGCTALTTVSSLPATTLAVGCYYRMFADCTSLTTAPDLLATTLSNACYYEMFSGCSSLNYIKMLALDITAKYCLKDWTVGVASTGTFIKNTEATWTVTGTSGVPTGWTVNQIDYPYADLAKASWDRGEEIMIAGESFSNTSTSLTSISISQNTNIDDSSLEGKIVFVNPNVTLTLGENASLRNTIIVSSIESQKVIISSSSITSSEMLALKNVALSSDVTISGVSLDKLYIDCCDVTLSSNDASLINLGSNGSGSVNDLKIEGTVFHSSSTSAQMTYSIVSNCSGVSFSSMSIKDNVFLNVKASSEALISANRVDNLTINRNLFYFADNLDDDFSIVKLSSQPSGSSLIDSNSYYPAGGDGVVSSFGEKAGRFKKSPFSSVNISNGNYSYLSDFTGVNYIVDSEVRPAKISGSIMQLLHVPTTSSGVDFCILPGGSDYSLSGSWPSAKTITVTNGSSSNTYSIELPDLIDSSTSQTLASNDSGWTAVWSDEFNSTDWDRDVWVRCPTDTHDWDKEQWPSDDSLVEVSDGALVTWAKKDSDTSKGNNGYITGGIWGKDLKGFSLGKGVSGRIDVRARMTDAKGYWPAIWMLPEPYQAWALGGEIDIMEHLNYEDIAYLTLHWSENQAGVTTKKNAYNYSFYNRTDWHVFTVLITDSILYMYIDGVKYMEYAKGSKTALQWPWDTTEYYMILDSQLNGDWAGNADGTDLPAHMDIDYVRYMVKE